MINAVRYGLATFLTFSKPLTFFGLAIATSIFFLEMSVGGNNELSREGLSYFGAQTLAMNALVLFFISVPVAGQFAQEYRFKTITSTLLMVPSRMKLFLSKTFFALLYALTSVLLMWGFMQLLGVSQRIVATGKNYSLFALTSGNFHWSSTGVDAYARMAAYILGYMLIVIAISVATRSQTLGTLIPFLYLAIVESIAATSDALIKLKVIQGPLIPDSFRFFQKGQAWINSDPHYPMAGIYYFGVCLIAFASSAVLFSRRSATN